jgi:hypothetical protein
MHSQVYFVLLRICLDVMGCPDKKPFGCTGMSRHITTDNVVTLRCLNHRRYTLSTSMHASGLIRPIACTRPYMLKPLYLRCCTNNNCHNYSSLILIRLFHCIVNCMCMQNVCLCAVTVIFMGTIPTTKLNLALRTQSHTHYCVNCSPCSTFPLLYLHAQIQRMHNNYKG